MRPVDEWMGLCQWSAKTTEALMMASFLVLALLSVLFTPILYTLLWEKREDSLEKRKAKRNRKVLEEYQRVRGEAVAVPMGPVVPPASIMPDRRSASYRDLILRDEHPSYRFRVQPAHNVANVSLRAPDRRLRTPSLDRDMAAAERFVEQLYNEPTPLNEEDEGLNITMRHE